VYIFTDDSDEEFLPMRGGAMSESVLLDTASMEGSVSSTVSSISSASKSGSVAASPSHRYPQLPCRVMFSHLNVFC
jgi:hypothetical protein